MPPWLPLLSTFLGANPLPNTDFPCNSRLHTEYLLYSMAGGSPGLEGTGCEFRVTELEPEPEVK